MFLEELLSSIWSKVIAALLAPIIVAIGFHAVKIFYLAFKALTLARSALKSVARQYDKGIPVEGPGLWLK